jgi:hypothetical protein
VKPQTSDLHTGKMGTAPYPSPTPPEKHILLAEDEYQNQVLRLLLSQRLATDRALSLLHDYSAPVDEYLVIGDEAAGLTFTPDFNRLSEMYECILFSLPLGTTQATLTLGVARPIALYNGPAITVQQPVALPHLNIVVNPGERRELDVQGTLTTNGYIGLMGYAFTGGK